MQFKDTNKEENRKVKKATMRMRGVSGGLKNLIFLLRHLA